LYGQLTHAVQDILRFLKIAFGSLNKRNGVLNIPVRLIQSPNLASQFFRHSQTARVVSCSVDPEPGAERFDVFLGRRASNAKFPVCKCSARVVINNHAILLDSSLPGTHCRTLSAKG
jgi:hypothetical protein